MRVLVLGAGAMGSVFGGFLRKAGHEVSLLGRSRHINAIRTHGLRISGIWGNHRIALNEAYTSPDEIENTRFDVVLISVKSYDTEEAATIARRFLGPQTLVVSLQNGLGNIEKIASAVGKKRTVGARVIFGVEIPKPGHAKVTVYAEEVMLGSPFPSAKKRAIAHLAETLSAAGIPSLPTDQITQYTWSKVLYNASLNPLSTMLGQPYGYLLENRDTIEIMKRVVEEVFTVANAANIALFWKKPEEYSTLLFTKLIPSTAQHHASMLQDINAGKKTEIDAINGAIVRLASNKRVPVPVNYLLTIMIKTMEKTKPSLLTDS